MITKAQLAKHAILFEIQLRSGNVDTIICPVCGLSRKVSMRVPQFPSLTDAEVIQAHFFKTLGCCCNCVHESGIFQESGATMMSIIHGTYVRP